MFYIIRSLIERIYKIINYDNFKKEGIYIMKIKTVIFRALKLNGFYNRIKTIDGTIYGYACIGQHYKAWHKLYKLNQYIVTSNNGINTVYNPDNIFIAKIFGYIE